jgi:hypothetical protein
MAAIFKIGKISMFSEFNENWYIGLFWSEELIGNDENCIQGHFYDATVSKMAEKLGLIVFGCKHRSPQTTPISEFGHVDASFIITNQYLTSKYS